MSEAGVCTTIVGIVILAIIGIPIIGVYVNQCQLGYGDSLHVQVVNVTLNTKPTDNVAFGAEWLFGKPADEISVHLQSGMCKNSNPPRDIQERQTIRFYDTLTINTFFRKGFTFWLEEADSWFEGSDDISEETHVTSSQLDIIRHAFDTGAMDMVEIDHLVTVEGKNIFQEHTWFGFLAENLCISALDFVTGPWGTRALLSTAGKSVGKKGPTAFLLNDKDIAKIYNKVKDQHKSGALTKSSIFKAVVTYQVREGAKHSVKGPLKSNAIDLISEWALDQTMLDEEIKDFVHTMTEQGIYEATGQDGLEIYNAVNEEMAMWGGYMATITDSLEFCLSEVIPDARDAVYSVRMTILP